MKLLIKFILLVILNGIASMAWAQVYYHQSPGKNDLIVKGNVGIGTTTPDYKLTVNGKIKAEEIQVVVDVPADYVFEKNYSLMPLAEVEKFVNENKHLPGMPDAQSFIANGWQVGEMNNKMLEKVEELTLYLFGMKKELDQIKMENEELKKSIQKVKRSKYLKSKK